MQNALSKASKENIQKSALMYSIYTGLNEYKGPANEEQMLEFLTSDSMAQKRLETMGMDVSNLSSYLTGRDGEKFEFRWGIVSSPLGGAYPVCWEQVGVDGGIQVGIAGGRIVETTDEDELADLKAGNYDAGNTYGDAMKSGSEAE